MARSTRRQVMWEAIGGSRSAARWTTPEPGRARHACPAVRGRTDASRGLPASPPSLHPRPGLCRRRAGSTQSEVGTRRHGQSHRFGGTFAGDSLHGRWHFAVLAPALRGAGFASDTSVVLGFNGTVSQSGGNGLVTLAGTANGE